MTQRQNKILGGRKSKKNKEDDQPIRKPMVFSYEDSEQMASESTKAKINLRDPAKSREFSSYFYGQKKNTDPFYIATSHEEKIPIPKKERVIPTYQAMVHGLRWSPSVESYEEHYNDGQEYLCRTCRNCQKQSYPEYSEEVRSFRGTFKDNIRRFVDTATMTPRLNDASCGVRSPRSQGSYTSVSITSETAARDLSNIQVRLPISRIHRARDYESNLNYQYYNRKPQVIPEVDDMDDEEYSYVSSPSVRRRRLPLCRKQAIPSAECDRSRKILYNEGISDMVATDYPNHCYGTGVHGSVKPKRNYSKASVFSRGIPYAHRNRSKYHYDCNEPDFNSYRCEVDDDAKHLLAKPRLLRHKQLKKPAKCEESIIKMPKKVLSSERDIDAYIRTRRPNLY